MPPPIGRPLGSFTARVTALRARGTAGEAAAWWELGCLLEDGDIDGRGRVRIAPDLRGAFRAFRRGAESGDDGALLNLGVCYDTGQGTRRDRAAAWRCYQRLWRRTRDGSAANNLATWHRDRGNLRLAVAWYRRAADARDGDAHVTLAYCHYYGLGTTKSTARALRELDHADRTSDITPYGHEEALYLRAVVRLDRGRRSDFAAAMSLLRQAAADSDYPEAEAVLADIAAGAVPTPCRCRRHLARTVKGQAHCPVHSRKRIRPGR